MNPIHRPKIKHGAARLLQASALALLLAGSGLAGAGEAPAVLHSGLDRASFDPRVRPQDDLFGATHGLWLKKTRIPADKGSVGNFELLGEQSDAQVRDIVSTLAALAPDAGSAELKVSDFYRAFLDTEAIERAGLRPLQPLLEEIAGLQDSSQLLRWMGRMQGQLNLPLQLQVAPDPKQPQVQRLGLAQGGLALPERDYYLNTQDPRLARSREAYRRYLQTLAGLLGEADPADAARRVLVLETRIAMAHWDVVASRDVQKVYNPMSKAELAALAPGLAWEALFEAAQLPGLEQLIAAQPSALKEIARLLAELPVSEWQLNARLRVADAYAQVLPRAFRQAHFEFHGRALSGTARPLPRWQKAVHELNDYLGEAVGRLYVAKHFPPAHKARMELLVGHLMAAYKDSIAGLGWMGPATQAAAQDKLAKYLVKIGYPEQWRDYGALRIEAGQALANQRRAAEFLWSLSAAKLGKPVDRREWLMSPQTVNAYYNETFNEIVFPAAILKPPFFDMQADDAVNYGAIGAVIGHEISHGFDDQGSQYDGDGMLRNWWSEADRKAFEAIGERLVAQFDAYEALPGKKVNGRLTLGENIADLSGLQIAFKAYQRSLGGKPAPVLGGLSGEQRFFYGFAQVWREKVRSELMLQQLMADPHSPGRLRANGAVLNHDAFHEAFKTRPGDKLYKPAGERIRIW